MEESSNWRYKCGRDWAQRVDMGLQCEYGAIASVIWAADPASHGHIEKVSAIFFFFYCFKSDSFLDENFGQKLK